MKFKSIILAFILVIVSASFVNADSVTEISTAEDLLKIKDNPSGSYILTDNIDMAGVSWEPFEFSGTLDGNNHVILNVNVEESTVVKTVYDANLITYEAYCYGFFASLENATIKNLGIWGINVECGGSDCADCIFAGLLSGYAYNSTVANCQFVGDASVTTAGHCFGTGGVFGFAGQCSINQCHVESQLICVDTDVEYKDEQFMGGAFAFGYSDVIDSYISIQGYDSDHGYVHNGGIVGCFMYYDCYTVDYSEVSIIENYICGSINFFEDNTDRRAYCDPVAGEVMHWNLSMYDNTNDFSGNEVFSYSSDLTPHCNCNCELTTYEVAARSGIPGYTLYVCEECGYIYKTNFTFPKDGVFTDNYVQNWQDPYVGCTDILLFSSHADDEQLFFAGLLPYYAQERNLAVQVVYCTDHIAEPVRHTERLNGLWGVGITHTPDTSGWYDQYADTIEEALANLMATDGISESDVIDWMRTIILKYKPQVIVTHDVNGEYGHGYHKMIASCLQQCLEKYGDEFTFLKKVYLHSGTENQVVLSCIDEPSGALDGMTPFNVTQKYGFAAHYTQHWCWFYNWIYGWTEYGGAAITKASEIESNTQYYWDETGDNFFSPLYYGLIWGDASLDQNHNDLFEGLKSYQVQEEEAIAAELERQRQEELEAQRLAEEAEQARLKQEKRDRIIKTVIIVICSLIAVILVLRIYNKHIRKKVKRKKKHD